MIFQEMMSILTGIQAITGQVMKWLIQAACLFSALLLAGCAAEAFSPEAAPELIIIKDFAPFYSIGPMQARGPDSTLRAGDRIKLLRKEMGYSNVLLPDERVGYIANEYMAPAPPRPRDPPSQAGPVEGGRSNSPRQSGSQRYRGQEVNDSPLPELAPIPALDLNIGPEDIASPPAEPSPSPSGPPKFRY